MAMAITGRMIMQTPPLIFMRSRKMEVWEILSLLRNRMERATAISVQMMREIFSVSKMYMEAARERALQETAQQKRKEKPWKRIIMTIIIWQGFP